MTSNEQPSPQRRSGKATISKKLLALIGATVFGAIGSYLILATNLFKNDKISLIYELNLSHVKTLSSEFDAELQSWIDRAPLVPLAMLPAHSPILRVALYDLETGQRVRGDSRPGATAFPKTIAASLARDLAEFRRDIQTRSSLAWRPSDVPDEKRVFRLTWREGRAAEIKRMWVADVSLDSWLRRIEEPSVATRWVIDLRGRPLVGPFRSGQDLPEALIAKALANRMGYAVERFQWNRASWLGAHAPLEHGGLTVLSQIPESEAFRAARRLVEKSIVLALFILTLALFVSRRFARSLTRPLEALVDATQKISKWEAAPSSDIQTAMRSNDEIGHLADAFHQMATDLRKQRDVIERHQRELEDKVRERTRELANAQEALVRTTRLASLGELAGAAAHEVLNPVNNLNIRLEKMRTLGDAAQRRDAELMGEIVEGWQKAFRDGGWSKLQATLSEKPTASAHATLLEEDLHHLADVARVQNERLLQIEQDYQFLQGEVARVTKIVNNMRALARVGGTRKPTDVHAAIEATGKALDDLLHQKGVKLTFDFAAPRDGSTHVLADHDELVQVFSNLLRNAMQALSATPVDQRAIRIATRIGTVAPEARDRKALEILIQDTGPGIPDEHRERIFEPDFTTKSLVEGTGLGLSISRRLIRAFGGDLVLQRSNADSGPKAGATFLITLPVIER